MNQIAEKIKYVKNPNFTWINIVNPENEEIDYLKQTFNFHPLDLRDSNITKKAQRPQLAARENYSFLIFLFPVYDRDLRKILPAEVDFFISDQFVTTLHDNKLSPLKELFDQCSQYEYYRDLYMGLHPSYFFYIILEKLLENCFPMLDHIADDNQTIEDNIFKHREKEMVREILIVKRNIVNFRFIMQSHRTIIKKFIDLENKYLQMSKHYIYFEKLLVQTKDIWEILAGHKETIDALQETNESSISFRINDVMKTLTLISVIFLPLTLISSIFGMNSENIPFSDQPAGFWMVLGIMSLIFLLMIAFFKKKKWL